MDLHLLTTDGERPTEINLPESQSGQDSLQLGYIAQNGYTKIHFVSIVSPSPEVTVTTVGLLALMLEQMQNTFLKDNHESPCESESKLMRSAYKEYPWMEKSGLTTFAVSARQLAL